ncbi:hypothetical protein CONLIGDRAFT_693864 [Coniochaeta ligniaria NRRL 30616]|uniref:Uncharacterized protein n=1 Tax=Coniochaeta ligniaria NRRL 30616 TaxID=1408157 RepID=A0A1J7J063_9PEZI|nr:hypothetical protein CONLIGDRAFT_693864 [Coniochaeta ligniaria NRRL 30616]
MEMNLDFNMDMDLDDAVFSSLPFLTAKVLRASKSLSSSPAESVNTAAMDRNGRYPSSTGDTTNEGYTNAMLDVHASTTTTEGHINSGDQMDLIQAPVASFPLAAIENRHLSILGNPVLVAGSPSTSTWITAHNDPTLLPSDGGMMEIGSVEADPLSQQVTGFDQPARPHHNPITRDDNWHDWTFSSQLETMEVCPEPLTAGTMDAMEWGSEQMSNTATRPCTPSVSGFPGPDDLDASPELTAPCATDAQALMEHGHNTGGQLQLPRNQELPDHHSSETTSSKVHDVPLPPTSNNGVDPSVSLVYRDTSTVSTPTATIDTENHNRELQFSPMANPPRGTKRKRLTVYGSRKRTFRSVKET